MAQRGRVSADAKLTLLDFTPALPEPPEMLTDSEAVIFRETAAAMPSGWFKADSIPLLVEYSRAQDACNRLAAMREAPDLSLRDLALLLGAHEKQARLVVSLATKMRLTQQSRILPDKAGRDVANKPLLAPPWGGKTGARAGTSPGSKAIAGSRTES